MPGNEKLEQTLQMLEEEQSLLKKSSPFTISASDVGIVYDHHISLFQVTKINTQTKKIVQSSIVSSLEYITTIKQYISDQTAQSLFIYTLVNLTDFMPGYQL